MAKKKLPYKNFLNSVYIRDQRLRRYYQELYPDLDFTELMVKANAMEPPEYEELISKLREIQKEYLKSI